jgi:hypothetical protein
VTSFPPQTMCDSPLLIRSNAIFAFSKGAS